MSATRVAPPSLTSELSSNGTRRWCALARTYGYDAASHTTSYSSMTATYNNAGRLKTVTNGSFTETLIYNGLGQRIETSGGAAGTVLYWYDEQGHLLGEYDGSGNLIEETVWLGDVPVATLQPNGTGIAIYYVHTDPLNTPRQVTRPADNAQMWTWFSDPFGTDAANANPSGAGAFAYNLRFPGQVFDGQVGLHSNYFRDYDPAIGRYFESDPLGLAGGSPSTYNYVGGSPILLVDPSGLADLNLFDRSPDSRDATGNYAGGNVWNIPGVYTVAGHGNPGNMEDDRNGTYAGWKPLWPADLAKIIRDDPNWKHRPVMLGGCNTGDHWENGHGGQSALGFFCSDAGQSIGSSSNRPSAIHTMG